MATRTRQARLSSDSPSGAQRTSDHGTDGLAKAIAGVEAVGSLGFAAIELLAPAVLGRPLRTRDGEIRKLGARDLVIGALLLASPYRKAALLLRAGADIMDFIRFRDRPGASVAGTSAVASLIGYALKRRR